MSRSERHLRLYNYVVSDLRRGRIERRSYYAEVSENHGGIILFPFGIPISLFYFLDTVFHFKVFHKSQFRFLYFLDFFSRKTILRTICLKTGCGIYKTFIPTANQSILEYIRNPSILFAPLPIVGESDA